MLTIQPKILNNAYRPAFKASEEDRPVSLADMDTDTYESMRDELEEQRDEIEYLADNEDFKLPKPVNKVLKGGAVVTTGLLGSMATGWGTKKSLTGLSKLKKTKAIKNIKLELKDFKTSITTTSKSIKEKFLSSNLYQKPVNAIKNAYSKFGETKFGKPIVKFFNTIGSGIKTAYKKVSAGIKYAWNKIRGVKKETWEKATVNTVGVSGGVASGITAIKEKSGDNE